VSLLRIPPQSDAGGARANALERRLHRALAAAGKAHHVVHRAVHLDHAPGRIARLLVQPVDVLRDERVQLTAPLQRDDRHMA